MEEDNYESDDTLPACYPLSEEMKSVVREKGNRCFKCMVKGIEDATLCQHRPSSALPPSKKTGKSESKPAASVRAKRRGKHVRRTRYMGRRPPPSIPDNVKLLVNKMGERHGKYFKCRCCSILFKARATLARHFKVKHTNTGNYQCQICKQQFKRAEYLREHRTIHTGEKRHTCDICDVSFRCRRTLRGHLRTYKHAQELAEKVGVTTEEIKTLISTGILPVFVNRLDVAQRIVDSRNKPSRKRGRKARGRPRKKRPDIPAASAKKHKKESSDSEEKEEDSEPLPTVTDEDDFPPYSSETDSEKETGLLPPLASSGGPLVSHREPYDPDNDRLYIPRLYTPPSSLPTPVSNSSSVLRAPQPPPSVPQQLDPLGVKHTRFYSPRRNVFQQKVTVQGIRGQKQRVILVLPPEIAMSAAV